MADNVVDALILDFLDWLTARDRTYEETMDAWRTSCPKLPVWEEANDRGLVMGEEVHGRCVVRVTSCGLALLAKRRLHAGVSNASSPEPRFEARVRVSPETSR
jgi:hypothetical protein